MPVKPHTVLTITLALLAAGLTFADAAAAPAEPAQAVEPPAIQPPEAPAATPPADAPQPAQPAPERIEKLVTQLGDDSFQVREAAEAKLIEIGLPAWELVEKAQRSQDAEIAMRARRIMERLHELKALLRIEAVRRNMLWKSPLDASPVSSMSMHGDVLLIGQLGKGVIAVDLKAGKVLWQEEMGDVDQSRPVAAGGHVFDCTDEGVRALDIKTGELAWSAKLEKLSTTPAVSDGLVVVATGYYVTGNPSRAVRALQAQIRNGNAQQRAAQLRKIQDRSSEIHAYDAKTGELKWKAAFDDSVINTPAAGHGAVVAAKMNGGAVILDAVTGKIRATVETKGAAAGITLLKDRAILQTGGQITAVNLDDGKSIWQEAIGAANAAGVVAPRNGVVIINGRVIRGGAAGDTAPIVRGERVYVTTPTTGEQDEPIIALDLNTGRKVWSVRPKSMQSDDDDDDAKKEANAKQQGGVVIRGNGAVIRGRVIVNGRVLNMNGVSTSAYTSPAEADGVLYVGGDDGLYAFDAKTGTQLWHFVTEYGVSAAPVVRDGVVYFAATGQSMSPQNARAAVVLRQMQQQGGNQAQQQADENEAGLYAVKIVETPAHSDAEPKP